MAEDFPAVLRLNTDWGTHAVELSGAALAEGVGIGELRGQSVEGSLRVGLCDKDTGVCTPHDFHVAGTIPDRQRGLISLAVTATEAPSPFGKEATAASADAAFARAARNGNLVLLDFSAVWCPPCIVLAADVLHADPKPAELEGFEVAVLDVDHRSSFTYKDRYAVGSYPTVIAVDAEGREVARTVGYESREAFLAWLADAPTSNEAAELAADPDTVSVERAAAIGWRWVQAYEFDAAEPWLARARTAAEAPLDLRLAEQRIAPTQEGLAWLVDHAADHVSDWAFSALELVESAPDLARQAAHLAVARASADQLGDALYLAAEVAPNEDEARLLFAAAASATAARMTGHPERDKAYVSFLAHLQFSSGDLEAARELLTTFASRHPTEPTWPLALANLSLDAGDPQSALASADRALALAWGDNRLRAAAAKAQALTELERPDEARAVAQAELDAFAPEAELDVRSHRYRDRLASFLADE